MSILTRPLTYDDLPRMPDGSNRYEIIEGEPRVAAAPTPAHQPISRRLVTWHSDFVEPRYLGEVLPARLDVVLGDHEVVQPVIEVVSSTRRFILGQTRIIGTPDLLIGILSDSTSIRDEVLLAHRYARSGLLERWIVDPLTREVRVFTLHAWRFVRHPNRDGYAVSKILAGFRGSLDQLFADVA